MSNTLKPQAMKRLLTIGLVLSSVFALTNCSEQLVTPEKEQINVDGNIENNTPQEGLASIPYEVYVNEPETKTIASGGKTYWVDEATALANGLGKDAVDRVTIYTMGADSKYTCHGKYTYAGNKKFVGDLYGESGEINNWYCLYPYNSSVAATGKSGIEETFIFGASAADNYIQTQCFENNMDHISGKNHPMYGTADKQQNAIYPTFTMTHLSSLIALKVVNQGDGISEGTEYPITIKDLSFSIPSVSTKDADGKPVKQSSIPIVGAFNFVWDGQTNVFNFAPVSNATSNTVKLQLTYPVTIEPGEYATFYIAVRPFDAGAAKLENKAGVTMTVTINGGKKTVEIPSDKVVFTSGSVTTLRVPIKFSYPKTSDAVEENLVRVPNSSIDAKINGETVPVYKINANQVITIQGAISECLKSLDAGFYTATLKNAPSAMTVNLIDLMFKDSSGNLKSFTEYEPFKTEVSKHGSGVGAIAGQLMPYLVSGGLHRDDGMLYLTKFIDPTTITFNGIVQLDAASLGDEIMIIDEAPIYKELGAAAVNTLLTEKFAYKNPETNEVITPTLKGMLDMISDDPSVSTSQDAETTATALIGKLNQVMMSKSNQGWMEKGLSFLGTIKLYLPDIMAVFFHDRETLADFLKNWYVKVEITPYPYRANKSDYSTSLDASTADPIYMWGIDITTAAERQ